MFICSCIFLLGIKSMILALLSSTVWALGKALCYSLEIKTSVQFHPMASLFCFQCVSRFLSGKHSLGVCFSGSDSLCLSVVWSSPQHFLPRASSVTNESWTLLSALSDQQQIMSFIRLIAHWTFNGSLNSASFHFILSLTNKFSQLKIHTFIHML